MSVSAEHRQLIQEMQSLAIDTMLQTDASVSLDVAAHGEFLYHYVAVHSGGECVYRSTSMICQDGSYSSIEAYVTLTEQRDALAELINKHRKREAA